jgi:hypothetical protein
MSYRFSIKAGSIEVLNGFLQNQFPGVSITHEPTGKPKPPPVMANDSAEDILQFIVNAAENIDINLFSAWLFGICEKSTRKTTTINGQQIPVDQAALAKLIVSLTEEQKSQSRN